MGIYCLLLNEDLLLIIGQIFSILSKNASRVNHSIVVFSYWSMLYQHTGHRNSCKLKTLCQKLTSVFVLTVAQTADTTIKLHGPPMLVDKTNFGLVIYNYTNFYRFKESFSYWSVKRILVFSLLFIGQPATHLRHHSV